MRIRRQLRAIVTAAVVAACAVTVHSAPASAAPASTGPSTTTVTFAGAAKDGAGVQSILCSIEIVGPGRMGDDPGTVATVGVTTCTSSVWTINSGLWVYREGTFRGSNGKTSWPLASSLHVPVFVYCIDGLYYANAKSHIVAPPLYYPPSADIETWSPILEVSGCA